MYVYLGAVFTPFILVWLHLSGSLYFAESCAQKYTAIEPLQFVIRWSLRPFIMKLFDSNYMLKSHRNSSLFCMEVIGLIFARFPFTMLVLQKAVRMVRELPDVMRIAYAFVLAMLCWMALWSFGVSGIVAFGMPNGGQWWLLLVSGQVFPILLYECLLPSLFRCFFLIIASVFADFFSQFILDWSCP